MFGLILINNVDECELKMHRLFSRERVNNRKNSFDVDLRFIITSIRMNLAQDIINDNFPNIEDTIFIGYQIKNYLVL